jgi:hypothetical protein
MVDNQRVVDNGADSMTKESPAAETERNTLDSVLDPDLDSYCKRMRSETAQGDELTIRAAAWALQINIRILKLNSTTTTIMALTYPGIPPNLEEVPGTLNSLASDAQDLRTITIAHYVHQHAGAGHYNPIFQQDRSELGLEEMDTVVDVESPDSGGNEQGSNSEPIVPSAIGDEKGARRHDHRRNSGAPERAAATMPLVAPTTMDMEQGVEEGENPDGKREANGKDGWDGLMRSATSTTRTTERPQNPDPMHTRWATERATAATEKQAGLLQFQNALRRKLTPKTWTSAGTLEQ